MTHDLASSPSNRAEFRAQDMHMLQHQEVLAVSLSTSDSGDLSRDITKLPTSVGIMVFSSACEVLYANQAAYHFLKTLNHREKGHAIHGALPVSIADLFDQILKSLESRIANRDHPQLEARRLLVGQDQSVLLRGFGIPDRLGIQRSRVVITMQRRIRPFDAESREANPISI